MGEIESFCDVDGHYVYTQEYIQSLRDEDTKKANNLMIIAQAEIGRASCRERV